MDGFASAFVFKKYLAPLLKIEVSEIIGLNPYDLTMGKFRFEKGDIVLDLPQPKEKVFFWCDHHLSAKPVEELPENYHWKEVPSCAGLLVDIAVKKGLKAGRELLDFKEALDIMDGAMYTKEQIKKVYYHQKNYDSISMLEKVHIISSMFHTGDSFLNWEIFSSLLSKSPQDLPQTPVEGDVWNLQPFIFFTAQLKGYEEWRKNIDKIIYMDEKSKCVVLDVRKEFIRGRKDRFYPCIRFEDSSYNLSLKQVGKEIYVGIGSNIFHKERCKVNIGKLCEIVGTKFGEGVGGGHYAVGGATIDARKGDDALKFILERLMEKN